MAKQRVLVAMSGGVDSSVTAYLLKTAGYDCVGATMLLAHGGCSSTSDIDDAAAICKRLAIPHTVLDLRPAFERDVVDKFVRTYEDGRTPNPCIDCNRHLKFGALLDYALAQGCDFIATGHYARIGTAKALAEPDPLITRIAELSGGKAEMHTLSVGVDASKDQSYVLYSLSQERLAHTLLPLGGLVKERDVRRIAAEQGFATAGKRDSQGICFVPDDDFASFIEERRGEPLPAGDIVDAKGTVLGRHNGAIRYTVGQRKGLGVALLHPVYVTGIDARANTVTLGENDDLMADGLIADDWLWSAPAAAMRELLDEAATRGEGIRVSAKIRYHQPMQTAYLSWEDASSLDNRSSNVVKIEFERPQRAIAPGQAVVVYAGDVMLGGGTVRGRACRSRG